VGTMRELHRDMDSAVSMISCLLFFAACNGRTTKEDEPIDTLSAYARARCQRLDECDCRSNTYEDRQQCESRIEALYDEAVSGRESIDLTCFADAAEFWERAPCDEPYREEPCNVIARTGLVGDACYFNVFHDLFLQAESCSEGLFCWNERCFDPEDALEEGMACTSEDLCDGGLTCIANQCAKRSAEG